MTGRPPPGDLTGDGRPDLPARHATTGNPRLRNRSDGAGPFGATVTVATGRQHYRALF
ncbi:hypothetical protein ABZ498_33155 [Streptomyces lavendulocolor]|uniref:hypothetical protein n=1 Tax=Streptomyces lavendulocolor TaxID=67316 RepID=UPI0033FC34D6